MKFILKSLSAIAVNLVAATAFAVPAFLTTHNNTDLESNAYIAGTIPSPHPTAAHTSRQVYWNMVRMACFGHTTNGKCTALIKIGTDTATPIDVGYVTLDLESGDIIPKEVSNNGYTLTINGPAEATLDKNQPRG